MPNNLSNVTSDNLYRKEAKVQPRTVKGKFANLRNLAMIVLLGLFYGLAWLPWDSRQAILFDLPARKFHVFSITFWPQDFIFLAMLLILAGFALFFFTALAGRLWCGFACPQTVWTEAFMLIERWVEGDRAKRIKLDKAPWNKEKIIKKSTKQFLWITFAAWTGFTFVGYFTPIKELAQHISSFTLGPWELFWIVFYGFATYGNAGYLREQVCKYMCPYARFQSAMFDKDTLIISYDKKRGEPRGSRRRGSDLAEQNLGSCIDCTLCVQVCPTGIDIRKGLQYECIACTACIDVCDQVMDKMDYPKGLIKYTSENNEEGGKTSVIRPRILIYGLLLSILSIALITAIAQRELVLGKLIHDQNALYQQLENGSIENSYTLRLVNKTEQDQSYSLENLSPNTVQASENTFTVQAGQTNAFPIRLHLDDKPKNKAVQKVTFDIRSQSDNEIKTTVEGKFLMPLN